MLYKKLLIILMLLLPVSQVATAQDNRYQLEPVITEGLERPLFMIPADDGTERAFIVEQPGRIRILQDGT